MKKSVEKLAVIFVIISKSDAFLFFPGGAAGMIFAIAVPLDLPKLYNVFLSYNFESNYRVPTMSTDFTKGPHLLYRVKRNGNKCYEKINKNDIQKIHDNVWSNQVHDADIISDINEECSSLEAPPITQMITRNQIYKWIESKLILNGFDGKFCLLRAICEHANSSFSKYNGILGDVIHILLSPYSSITEKNMEDYLEAETREDCTQYIQKCQTNLLEFITNS